MLSEQQIKQYYDEGFLILKKFWSEELLMIWEKTIISFYYMQANKIPEIKKRLNHATTIKDLDRILILFEKHHKQAGYQASQLIRTSMARNLIFTTTPFISICSQLLKCPKELLNIGDGVMFSNMPHQKRLLYQWHTEASYYPKRRNFVNGWFPIFRNKTKKNGTMMIMPKSHKKPYWDFMEHFGYDNTSQKTQTRIQFEVPTKYLTEYEQKIIEIDRGDLILLDRNMLHASLINQSSQISYASIVRIFDTRNDLTLSSVLEVCPFTSENQI